MSALSDKFDEMVEAAVRRAVASDPNQRLTKVGFEWAWIIHMEAIWPNVERPTLVAWLHDYLPVRIGTPGYDWTPSGAKNLARDYTSEFGETA